MSKRQTIVINNTGQVGDFYDKRLQPGESWSIPDVTIDAWREDTTLSGLLISGDLLVNDGYSTLSSGSGAVDYFYDTFPDIEAGDFVNVTKVGNTMIIGADEQELTTTVVNPGVTNFVTSISGTQVIGEALAASASGIAAIQQALQNAPPVGQAGSVLQIPFVHEGGNSANRWLCTGGDNGLSSDKSPAVVPFDCKVISMTYTNRDNNSDVDLELYSVPEAGTNSKDIEFVWQLRDARVARKSNFDPEIILEAGDRLAVYSRDAGVKPDYIVFTLYLQILNNNSEEVVRMFSGNFKVGKTPNSDS